jgi:hypothetical protein
MEKYDKEDSCTLINNLSNVQYSGMSSFEFRPIYGFRYLTTVQKEETKLKVLLEELMVGQLVEN